MTSLKDIGEFGLINGIKKRFKAKSQGLLLGIGDDCAVTKNGAGGVSLISTDILAEGVHFDLRFFTPLQLGMRAAAVNISDIAAMGGIPKYLLVSVAIPEKIDHTFITGIFTGIKKVCTKYDIALIGGDTSSSQSGLFVSVTVIGEARLGKYVTRAGAAPGDIIFVTGNLGDSAGGLDVLKNNRKIDDAAKRSLIRGHISVTPRVNEGIFLARSGVVTSMIDVSDGVGSDIRRICEASGTGAVIRAGALPISAHLRRLSEKIRRSPEEFALRGGEDYELLFTVAPGRAEQLAASYKERFKKRVHEIGVATRGKKICLAGKERQEMPSGYNHFGDDA